jgi:hypothetical protein
MTVNLTCATDVLSSIGVDLTPDEVVDLRLRVIRKSTKAVVTTVNVGKSSEVYKDFGTLANDVYLLAVDVYNTLNFGDLNVPVNLDLTLNFEQLGIMDQTLEYPKVMTNAFMCSSYRVYLAQVTKNGANYTVERAVSYPTSVYSGNWAGNEMDFYPKKNTVNTPYESQVELFMGCSLLIKNLGLGWMTDFWGETPVAGGTASITINAVAGTVTIPEQYYMTTVYNGLKQDPYLISGSGTIDLTGPQPKMVIDYDLSNYGESWATYCYTNKYLITPLFHSTLTLTPAAVKMIRQAAAIGNNTPAEVKLLKNR